MKNDELEIVYEYYSILELGTSDDASLHWRIYDGCGLRGLLNGTAAAAIDNIYLHHNSKIPNQIY